MLAKRVGLFLSLVACATIAAAQQVTLLDFYLPTCGPCRAMAPTVERLAATGVAVRKVDGQAEPQLAQRFNVTSYPTFIAVRDGQEVGRVVGATSYDDLARLVGPPSGPTFSRVNDVVPAVRTLEPRTVGGDLGPGQAAPPTAEQLALVGAAVRLTVEDPAGRSFGTGTVIDAREGEALVVTCAHLFRNEQGQPQTDTSRMKAEFYAPSPNGPQVTQQSGVVLLSYDFDSDVALVSVRPQSPVPAVKVAGSTASIVVGDAISTVGCDLGANPSVRTGQLVSHNPTHRPANIVATGAPIQGRSGGGIFNSRGELIGVCFGSDEKANEGLYATLESVHAQLDKLNLSDIYRGNTSPMTLASATTALPAATTPAPAPLVAVAPMADPSQLVPVTAPRSEEAAPVMRGQNAWGSEAPAAATASAAWDPAAMSNVERAALSEIATRAADSEVVLVIRPKTPGGKSEILTLDSVSPQFLQALQAMQTRR